MVGNKGRRRKDQAALFRKIDLRKELSLGQASAEELFNFQRAHSQGQVLQAMRSTHPYEEIAFDIYGLNNIYEQTGSGIIGELESSIEEIELLNKLKKIFKIPVIRHTSIMGKKVKKIAVCGGAGSFLTGAAKSAGADVYLTADIKYHEFFDAENRLLLADIGHYESEQFTIDLLFDLIQKKFPKFAVLKTGRNTNPVKYF